MQTVLKIFAILQARICKDEVQRLRLSQSTWVVLWVRLETAITYTRHW